MQIYEKYYIFAIDIMFNFSDFFGYMTLAKRYTASSHTVYNLGYHIVFCPKYRRRILVGDLAERLKELFREKADSLSIVIAELEVMPDHVHMFVKCPPTYAPHFVVNQFKGYSSRNLRREFPYVRRRLPTLWTRSYYIESVGHISDPTIARYIANQKNV